MHPLVGGLSDLSNEELHKKFSELQTKYNQAFRFGPTSVIPQMQMILENYREEIDKRNRKMTEEMDKKSDKYKGVIDIQ
jgi:2-oxo-4-hydroxy-4-carboxy--5-ureidoimidazoline (OHCU) decarboxylase